MSVYARKEVVREGEVGIYHCVARCVRHAFLCGEDPVSGKNFEHRREWIQERLELLAANFACDVCGFSAMHNHLHVILRTRPDVAEALSDEEVALRCLAVPHLGRRRFVGSGQQGEEGGRRAAASRVVTRVSDGKRGHH